ncbi:hypothetical protein HKD37_07G019309 [Glycine soja]
MLSFAHVRVLLGSLDQGYHILLLIDIVVEGRSGYSNSSSFFHGLFPSGWRLLSPILLCLPLHLHGGKTPLKDLIEAQRSSLHRSPTSKLPSSDNQSTRASSSHNSCKSLSEVLRDYYEGRHRSHLRPHSHRREKERKPQEANIKLSYFHGKDNVEANLDWEIRVEQQLKKKSTSKSYGSHSYPKKDQGQDILGVTPSKPKDDKGKTIEKQAPKASMQEKTSSIKCFKCLGRGHITSQCPTTKTMIMRGQDIYSSQDEATTSPSSSESEKAKGEESSEEIYPQEEGQPLVVKEKCKEVSVSSKSLAKKETHFTIKTNIKETFPLRQPPHFLFCKKALASIATPLGLEFIPQVKKLLDEGLVCKSLNPCALLVPKIGIIRHQVPKIGGMMNVLSGATLFCKITHTPNIFMVCVHRDPLGSDQGVPMNPKRIKVIPEWPTPPTPLIELVQNHVPSWEDAQEMGVEGRSQEYEEPRDLRSNPFQGGGNDAILSRKGIGSFFHGLFPSGWRLLSPILLCLPLHLHGGKTPLKDLIEAQRSSLHRSPTSKLPSSDNQSTRASNQGFSTFLHSFSSSSGHISFVVCREVDTQSLIGKADSSHRKKLRTYLGIVARDKVDVTYENWKEVPTAQKDLIWEDIQAEFDILKASNSRTKKKLLQTVGERWRQFKSDLTRKWALAVDQDGVEDTVCEKYNISKEKWAQFCQTRRDPSWEKLLAKKTKKKLEEVAQSRSVDGIIDPPSPVRCHVKWKMVRTKKTGEMTTEAAKEIAEKIDSFEEQATQGSFVPYGRQDVLAAAIGRPKHLIHVRVAGAGVTIKQYFGSASRTSRNASSLPPDELQQLTQQIRDQLEESITEKVTRQVMASFSHMQSQLQSQMQSHGIAMPPNPLVGPSGPRVSTKGCCVDPSGNDLETGDSDRCGLYIEVDPARLVAMGIVYEGSTVVHNTPLLPGQVKVSVEEVTDADAPVPVPTDEVSLVGQELHTFLAWPTHLVKSLSQQVAVSPAKPPPKPDPEVDDPLYLMTLIIPELFLRPYQVRWDATVFGVFNPDFPLYIKHEDLSEIAHGGQCLNISVLQLWILHLTETCMRVGNYDIYGFLEPQSIQRSGYIKSWMQSSQRDVYLGAYLNGEHWQMVVILPKEHLVVWFCSLHNRTDNYLKGIINSALKGLDDVPQPKSKASARQKGSTECGYYVMHWMSTIILGTFRNNWEAYFNDPRPLEPERLKALRFQWAQFYLRVRDQA